MALTTVFRQILLTGSINIHSFDFHERTSTALFVKLGNQTQCFNHTKMVNGVLRQIITKLL